MFKLYLVLKYKVLTFLNRFKKPIGVWIVSFILLFVSIKGLLVFPDLLSSLSTLSQYLVAISHITYSITGIAIVIGIWRSVRLTWVAVIIWGVTILGAAIGGPLAFAHATPNLLRTIIAISIVIFLITYGLLWYVRRITCTKT